MINRLQSTEAIETKKHVCWNIVLMKLFLNFSSWLSFVIASVGCNRNPYWQLVLLEMNKMPFTWQKWNQCHPSINLTAYINKQNFISSQKSEVINFTADKTTLALFEAAKEWCFHCMTCRFVSGSKAWIHHPSLVWKLSRKSAGSESNKVRSSHDVISQEPFSSGIRRREGYTAEVSGSE